MSLPSPGRSQAAHWLMGNHHRQCGVSVITRRLMQEVFGHPEMFVGTPKRCPASTPLVRILGRVPPNRWGREGRVSWYRQLEAPSMRIL
jgi:hypothetical protein